MEVLVSAAMLGLLVSLVLPSIQQARERARAAQCISNLHQLGIALAAHEAALGVYPDLALHHELPNAGRVDVPISLQFRLLPYLDQQPLHDSIDLTEDGSGAGHEPPASDSNSVALQALIPLFVCPSDATRPGGTNYRACTGTTPGLHTTPLVPPPAGAWSGFASGRVRRPRDVRDGLSATVFVSERVVGDGDPTRYSPDRDTLLRIPGDFLTAESAADACRDAHLARSTHASYPGSAWLFGGHGQTWYNHVLPPNSSVPDCTSVLELRGNSPGAHTARSYHPVGVHVLFGDGAVKSISDAVDLAVWRAIGTIDGREVVSGY